ncbi:MAG: sigma-70 family RNA polymerase sigma factor [Crocosphaera sp.]
MTQIVTKKMIDREGKSEKQITQKRERAFRELLKKYYGLITKLVNIYGQKNQRSHQKDFIQEAIIAFYEAITKFDKSRKVKLSTWIVYGIRTKLKARSQQIKKQEKTIKQVRINQEQLLIIKEESSRKIQLKQVLDLLCQLKKKQQEVVTLQLKGGSWAAIAKTLKSTPDAVRMVWKRAVKRLRKLLNNGQLTINSFENLEKVRRLCTGK